MRLFIAIDIGNELRTAVERLQRTFKGRIKNQSGLKWVSPECVHLTLKFLGEVDEIRIEEINLALETACLGAKPFELEFSKVGTFGRPARVLWLGSTGQNTELVKLAGEVEETLSETGFEKEQRDFSAHLTLARIKNPGIDRAIKQILDDFPKISLPVVIVDSVCMYKSQLTSDGPVYTLLKRIGLTLTD